MRKVIEEYELGAVTDSNLNSITNSIAALEKIGRRRLTKDLLPLSWQAQAEQLRVLYHRVLSQDNAPTS
jgi:hypothetical protein